MIKKINLLLTYLYSYLSKIHLSVSLVHFIFCPFIYVTLLFCLFRQTFRLFGTEVLSHTWTCKRTVSVPLWTLGISFTVKLVIKDNFAFAMQHFSAAVQHDSSAHDSRGHHLFHISLMFSVPHLLNSVKTTLSEKKQFQNKKPFSCYFMYYFVHLFPIRLPTEGSCFQWLSPQHKAKTMAGFRVRWRNWKQTQLPNIWLQE